MAVFAPGRPSVTGLICGGVAPSSIEAMQEFVFDFRCDVAVGLHETVGQVVPEAFGLGDFWDAVGDEPGLMRVPQAVECQTWAHWRESA